MRKNSQNPGGAKKVPFCRKTARFFAKWGTCGGEKFRHFGTMEKIDSKKIFSGHTKNGGPNALPLVSCRRTVLLRDKSDIDIAVVAVDGQRFFAALLVLGQIALFTVIAYTITLVVYQTGSILNIGTSIPEPEKTAAAESPEG